MELSRRHLLRVGQAALAAAALPKAAFSAEWQEKGFRLSQKGFEPLISAAFRVSMDAGTARWFTLLSVEDLTPKIAPFQPAMIIPRYLKIPASPKTETFALHFASSGDELPQGMYNFEHDATGPVPLFVVPSGNSTFIAIINQLS